jgi:hypothetical protein
MTYSNAANTQSGLRDSATGELIDVAGIMNSTDSTRNATGGFGNFTSTPPTRNINRDKGSAEANYSACTYSNVHGCMQIGVIDQVAACTAAMKLQGFDGRQQFSMDKTGPRKGYTTSVSPTNFQLGCGYDKDKKDETAMIYAENGNLNIIAGNGKILIQACDIEFVAKGKGGEGNIVFSSNENIIFKDCKKFQVTASELWKIATPKDGFAVANGQLKIISKVIRGITVGCSLKDGKFGDQKAYMENAIVN